MAKNIILGHRKSNSKETILFFDTETTGVPRNYNAPVTDTYNWPRLVQLGWIVTDEYGEIIKQRSRIVRPEGFTIPSDASSIHGITTYKALREGYDLADVLQDFCSDLASANRVVGHNIDFDIHIVGAELVRKGMDYLSLTGKPSTCTMKQSTNFCAINGNYGYKWPRLEELYCKLFGHNFSGAHDALSDITATRDCYFELKRKGII